jgi:hypothetical protein
MEFISAGDAKPVDSTKDSKMILEIMRTNCRYVGPCKTGGFNSVYF